MSNYTSQETDHRSTMDADTLEATAANGRRSGSSTTSSRLQTVPHRAGVYDVAPDVVGLKIGIVNVYFIGAPGSSKWVLVDAGIKGYASQIKAFAQSRFGGSTPQAILLTHGHFDHRGCLEDLWPTTDIPIYAHRRELPFLTGGASYPPADPYVGDGIMPWVALVYPRDPVNFGGRVQPLLEDGSVPFLPEWRYLETPGHTPGHVSFYRDDDRTLIAGDAFVTVRAESLVANLTLAPEVRRPPGYFTPDWPAARMSVTKLAELLPETVATGHGIPLRGQQMRDDLLRLSGEFRERALPKRGRYREIPALFDEATGLFRVPKMPYVWQTLLGGLVVGFLLGAVVPKSHDEPSNPREK